VNGLTGNGDIAYSVNLFK